MHILLELLKSNNRVIWNDHHDTSIELVKKYPQLDKKIEGIRDKKYSGAMLTYMNINNLYNIQNLENSVPKVIKLVSDWDTFQHRFGDITRYFKYTYFTRITTT